MKLNSNGKALLVSILCVLSLFRAQAEPGWNPILVRAQAEQLIANKDFNGLDAMVTAIKARGYDIRQGDTELNAFYRAFTLTYDASEDAWHDRLQAIKDWGAANPDSLGAQIALAKWHMEHGWRSRGPGYSNTVTEAGASGFEADAAQAAKALKSVSSRIEIDDPYYYVMWVDVCMAESRPKEEMYGYLNKSIDLAKEYTGTYMVAAQYLLERWYGEHGELEQCMKTWADRFPPEKGDVFYGFLLFFDSRYLSDDVFKLDVSYDRAKSGLGKRIVDNDPEAVYDENDLLEIAATKGDKALMKMLLFDLEGVVDNDRIFSGDTDSGLTYYHSIRTKYKVPEALDKELALERTGRMADAELLLKTFTIRPDSYRPLAYFYERHGMKKQLLAMDFSVNEMKLRDMAAMNVATAPVDVLAEVAAYYAMTGDWDKAEAAGRRFDQLRPVNFIGKNILLLCAVHKGDTAAAQAALHAITSYPTDRKVYRAAQSILTGAEAWDVARNKPDLTKADPHLAQAIEAIALYDIAIGNKSGARTVIEESLANCEDNRDKTLLESLLYGSLAYLSGPPVAAAAASSSPGAAGATGAPAATRTSQGNSVTVTITPKAEEGYVIGPVKKGTKITFQYVSGKWKSWGHLATANPDEEKPEGGSKCRVAIAAPGVAGAAGEAVTTLPSGTRYTPFEFEAKEDYPKLILRINSPTFTGPGSVVYTLTTSTPK